MAPARRSPPLILSGGFYCAAPGRAPPGLSGTESWLGPPHPSASPGRLRPPPCLLRRRGWAGLAGLLGSFVLLVRWSRGRRAAASSVVPPSLTRRPRWSGLRGHGRYRSWRRLSRPAARPNRPVRASLPRGPSPSSRCAAMPALGPRCPFRGRAASGLPAGSRPLR